MNHIRSARKALPLAFLLPATALMAASPSAASQKGGDLPHNSKPTVVLVHGAWADASGWDEVTKSLQARGYPVVATANPLRSLSGDAAYLAARLKTIKGPVVLVGHSYGGAVITNAAAGNPNVKSLVYIAGFAPDKGESLEQILGRYPGSQLTDDPEAPVPTSLDAVPYGSGSGEVDLYIKPNKFSSVFLSDRLEASEANVLAASQRPTTPVTVGEPSGQAAWKSVPSWFLVATEDRTIGTDNLRFMAERAGSTTVEVDAPHAVLETNPEDVTGLILQAADGSRPSLAKTGSRDHTAWLAGAAVLMTAGGVLVTVRARQS